MAFQRLHRPLLPDDIVMLSYSEAPPVTFGRDTSLREA